nr:aspartate--tRNA ligase 2, cytoplasmic-like isoform X2 [Lolium perenne]
MSMSTEQQQQQQTAVTKKHSVSREGRRAKSKKKTAQDPYDSLYGRVPLKMFHERPWTYAGWLDGSKVGNYVLLFGNVMRVRPLSKTSTIVVLLSRCRTVRCMVVASADEGVTTRMVRFAATLRRGTYLEVEGVVSPPGMETDMLLRTTQQVEIQVRKLYTIATNKDGSLVDGVTTTEEDDDGAVDGVTTMEDGNPVDGVVATMENSSLVHGVIIDGVTTMEDISLVGRATTAEDGSLVHGVATMEDDILVDSVATMEDDSQVDGASQSSSISIPTRPSIMLPENPVGREGETQVRKDHTIVKYGSPVDAVAAMENCNPVDELSQSSSISITTRPIMLPENMVGRKGAIQVRTVHTITTMKDGSPVDGVAMMSDDGSQVDGVSQSSISITTRPSIMLQDNLVGREAKLRNLHTIATMQDGSTIHGASNSSSISITTRPSIMLEENLVGREGEPRWVGQAGWGLAHADERPSLNYDYANPLPVCHAIFRIHSEVEYKIMEFLRSMHFVGIHTHGTFAGSVEGGLAVVNPEDITGQRTFLAQSPLLYKQMATCEVKRVFEFGPMFRHENSNCKMHTCDLAAEMEIKDHYLEVCDIVNALLVDLFKHLNKNCKKELEAISQRYPAEPPKYLEETLMLKYDDGIQMLKMFEDRAAAPL